MAKEQLFFFTNIQNKILKCFTGTENFNRSA